MSQDTAVQTPVEREFFILRGPDGPLGPYLERHTEVCAVFHEFKEKHPEAQKYELRFNPAPWVKCGAQPFKHVPDRKIKELHARWKAQLDGFTGPLT